jgi:mannose-6-phosphate isomerase-like protein (cupin superfamily)
VPTKPYHVDVHELPRQSRFGGLMEETAVVMDGALLKFSWAKPADLGMTGRTAAAGKPDVHPFDQVIFLVSGRVEVTLGEGDDAETFTLEPGHLIYIPADMPHIGRVLGDEPAFGVDVFAPAREDYFDMAEHQLALERAAT